MRSHDGFLDRREHEVILLIPVFVKITAPTSAVDPAIVDLSDEELIRIAESAVLPRAW